MKFVIMLIFFILILPYLIEFNFYYEKESRKLYLSIYLYSFIKIISGYFTLEEGYIAFHLKKKAILIAPSTLVNTGKKYKKIMHFEIYYIYSNLFIGDFSDFNLYFLVFYNFLINNFGIIYKMYKNFSYVKNDIVLYKEDLPFKFFIKVKIAFNMVVLLIILIKKIMENFINAKKSKKRRKYN